MHDNDFQPGDLVKLKSGGPTMTYSGKHPLSSDAICVWFEEKTKREDRFAYAVLMKVEA